MIDRIKIDGLNLRPKLLIAFLIVALLVGVTGFVGYTSINDVNNQADKIGDDAELMDGTAHLRIATEKQINAIQSAQLGEENAEQQFDEGQNLFEQERQRIEDERDLTQAQQQQLEDITSAEEEYAQLANEYFDAREAGNEALAAQKAAEMDGVSTELLEATEALGASAEESKAQQDAQSDSVTQTARTIILALTVGAFIVAIAIGLFVARRITTPINQLSEAAVAASEGDLDTKLDDHVESDEIGRMVEAFKRMQTNLRNVFAELDAVGQDLDTGNPQRDVETDYPGSYGEIMQSIDSGTTQLTESFDEIQA